MAKIKPETINVYQNPRYDSQIAQSLYDCVESKMWDDWDLEGLLYEVPHNFADQLGSKHGIFCCSGTQGLHASLLALDLQPGDQVIVPCMTFIRAVTPLLHLQLVPVLADIDPTTGNLNAQTIEKALTSRVKAVIVVHMWGIVADIDEIKKVCDKNNLYLIEDFSHAHFSKHTQGYAGSFGHISFASLQKKKVLSTGEGGIIVTNADDIYERLKRIVAPGSFKSDWSQAIDFSGHGLNLRMSPFSAVVCREILEKPHIYVSRRQKSINVMKDLITKVTDLIEYPHVPQYAEVVSYYGFKPKILPPLTLDKLKVVNQYNRWQFSEFGYDAIADSPFWKKDKRFYPFNLGIQPLQTSGHHGYAEYLRNRISLAVPTMPESYWTQEVIENWTNTLKAVFS